MSAVETDADANKRIMEAGQVLIHVKDVGCLTLQKGYCISAATRLTKAIGWPWLGIRIHLERDGLEWEEC